MRKIFPLMLLLFVTASAFSQIRISELPAVTGSPSGAIVPVVIGGVNKKETVNNIAALRTAVDSFYRWRDTITYLISGRSHSFKDSQIVTNGSVNVGTLGYNGSSGYVNLKNTAGTVQLTITPTLIQHVNASGNIGNMNISITGNRTWTMPDASGTFAFRAADSTASAINMIYQGTDGLLHKAAIPTPVNSWTSSTFYPYVKNSLFSDSGSIAIGTGMSFYDTTKKTIFGFGRRLSVTGNSQMLTIIGQHDTVSASQNVTIIGKENYVFNADHVDVNGYQNILDGVEYTNVSGQKNEAYNSTKLTIEGQENYAEAAHYTTINGYQNRFSSEDLYYSTIIGWKNTNRNPDDNQYPIHYATIIGRANYPAGYTQGTTAVGYRNGFAGSFCIALGNYNSIDNASERSSAIGIGNRVAGLNNTGVGRSNVLTTDAEMSSAFGYGNDVEGRSSSAFGKGNVIDNVNESAAFGKGLHVQNSYMGIYGMFLGNMVDDNDDSSVVVGFGTNYMTFKRSNANSGLLKIKSQSVSVENAFYTPHAVITPSNQNYTVKADDYFISLSANDVTPGGWQLNLGNPGDYLGRHLMIKCIDLGWHFGGDRVHGYDGSTQVDLNQGIYHIMAVIDTDFEAKWFVISFNSLIY